MGRRVLQFDRAYYAGIWGDVGVHRHDFCSCAADALIAKHGLCRILDIGTGCGKLVRVLRERGCDAWGMDVSPYAVANTCAPGYVVEGSVTEIPFRRRFDVIHSNGLWEYVPEAEVERAWAECMRAGSAQFHNYDTTDNDCPPEYQIITMRSPEWWRARLRDRILVACPNYDGKEYAFARWIERVTSLTHPAYDVLVVDNSTTPAFYERWRDRVPMVRVSSEGGPEARINRSMETIRKHFLAGPYHRWMNIEADNIPPCDVIEQMLSWDHDTDWLSHAYPERGGEVEVQQGIGCSLFSRRLMESFCFDDAGDNYTADGWLWSRVRPDPRFRVMEAWHYMNVAHLAGAAHA